MVIRKACPKNIRSYKSAIVVNEESTRKVLAEPNISKKNKSIVCINQK